MNLTYACPHCEITKRTNLNPDDEQLACGHCDACSLRKKGFAEAGVKDPTRYVSDEQ